MTPTDVVDAVVLLHRLIYFHPSGTQFEGPLDSPDLTAHNLDSPDWRPTMSRIWQLQEAKNRLSEVVDEAVAHGPQTITRRGKDTVVVISVDEFRRLQGRRMNLVEFFRSSPMVGADLDLERDSSPLRDDIVL